MRTDGELADLRQGGLQAVLISMLAGLYLWVGFLYLTKHPVWPQVCTTVCAMRALQRTA
ncbi:MAG: hypothetical protein ACUVX9_03185 [Anaerolineae bacterium]